MNERIRIALVQFKLCVAEIEAGDDSLELDKALARASGYLYDIRHLIDMEWAEARPKAKHTLNITKVDAIVDLDILNYLVGKDTK